MNPTLAKFLFRSIIKRAARGCLVGRAKNPNEPTSGRFERGEIDTILSETWKRFDAQASTIPYEPTFGSRLDVTLSCVTLACFEVLIASGIQRYYAIELIGDVVWVIYRRWGRIPFLLARLRSRDPVDRLRLSVQYFLRFPFNAPGYRFDVLPSEAGFSLNMLRCPVAEYFLKHDAPDLCIGTWCNQDFALAESWGGVLSRPSTLAAGCAHCDFRFAVES